MKLTHLVAALAVAACTPSTYPTGADYGIPQSAFLYCDMQGQNAANQTGGGLYGSAAYEQARKTCIQMKQAERNEQAPADPLSTDNLSRLIDMGSLANQAKLRN